MPKMIFVSPPSKKWQTFKIFKKSTFFEIFFFKIKTFKILNLTLTDLSFLSQYKSFQIGADFLPNFARRDVFRQLKLNFRKSRWFWSLNYLICKGILKSRISVQLLFFLWKGRTATRKTSFLSDLFWILFVWELISGGEISKKKVFS